MIKEKAYDAEFVHRYVTGFDELCHFVGRYTPRWAAGQCGVKEKNIRDLVREIAEDRPGVIFHPGWNLSRYSDSFYASRALYILNALMGSIERQGGLIIPKGPSDCGAENIPTLDALIPRPEKNGLMVVAGNIPCTDQARVLPIFFCRS